MPTKWEIARDDILIARCRPYSMGGGAIFCNSLGVVVAVDESFDGLANLWAETQISRADGTYGRATLWDIR